MIIDCFTFYNELDVLKKRLKYLDKVVDKFIIVESTVTHRGDEKKLFFDENKKDFDEWLDKITHVIVRDNPDDKNPWSRENHQRNCILRGLDNCNENDLIMISDVDEIPNREAIKLPDGIQVLTYNMIAFQYSFKFIQNIEPWFGTVLTTFKFLKTTSPQNLRDTRWSNTYYQNAGWHLSSFGDAEFAANKNFHFAHCHDTVASSKTLEDFKGFVNNGIHTDGKHKLLETPVHIVEMLPKELS
jgi:hypothetical protein